MSTGIGSLLLVLSLSSVSGSHRHHPQAFGVLPPGPGNGWGFRNGNLDGYGWYETGYDLPLGADRGSQYYFQRRFAMTPTSIFLPSYYNPYISRGQRYLPYIGDGGCHPLGGHSHIVVDTPTNPYQDSLGAAPLVPVPTYGGRVEGTPINPGGSGLRP